MEIVATQCVMAMTEELLDLDTKFSVCKKWISENLTILKYIIGLFWLHYTTTPCDNVAKRLFGHIVRYYGIKPNIVKLIKGQSRLCDIIDNIIVNDKDYDEKTKTKKEKFVFFF